MKRKRTEHDGRDLPKSDQVGPFELQRMKKRQKRKKKKKIKRRKIKQKQTKNESPSVDAEWITR